MTPTICKQCGEPIVRGRWDAGNPNLCGGCGTQAEAETAAARNYPQPQDTQDGWKMQTEAPINTCQVYACICNGLDITLADYGDSDAYYFAATVDGKIVARGHDKEAVIRAAMERANGE